MSPDKLPTETLIGTILEGAYRIEGLLGEGGMGAVYTATQLRLEKRVAVKVMSRELATNPEALARFHREAQVTSGLGHPHIVQVFDFSATPNGEPFLVMEFLQGEDLEHRLRRARRLPAAEVAHIIGQVASALAATHAQAIVHRDLKPANIFLLEVAGETNFVKVLDFGISKMRSATRKLTRTSSVMGTANYMSPEQAQGRNDEVEESTDQWALACIAWECLSGERTFDGDGSPSILYQVVHEAPPALLPKVPGLPPQVEAVLLHALAKNKNARFASVNDFSVALTSAIAGTAGASLPSVPQAAQASKTAVEVDPVISSPPSTTFTKTAGEISGEAEASGIQSKALAWGLAGGAAAVVLAGAFWFLRPTVASKPMAADPRPTVPVSPAPGHSLAVPPPEPVPAARAEEAPLATSAIPTVVPAPKPKKGKRSNAADPKAARPGAAREQQQQPTPASSKESQDKWRLD